VKGIVEKKCSRCKEVKSITEFSAEKTRKDGHSYCCRLCKNKSDTAYKNTELGYLKGKYFKMNRKEKEFKRLLTLEEFLASWEKHKSTYGMRSAWGPGPHDLEQHKLMTMIYLGKGQRGKSGNIKGSKTIKSNLSVDRLDSSKDYTAQNIIFVRNDENRRKNDSSYEDCKIHMKLYEERFKNEPKTRMEQMDQLKYDPIID
jgi:phage FluMu protein Com